MDFGTLGQMVSLRADQKIILCGHAKERYLSLHACTVVQRVFFKHLSRGLHNCIFDLLLNVHKLQNKQETQ